MKKNPIVPILMILFSVLIFAVMPTEAEGAIYEDTVRLHILANSDSEADQSLKLEIRDKILEKYGVLLSGCHSKEEAEAVANTITEDIKRDCETWIKECGYTYGATVEVGTEWYETRVYENFTLPSGYYTSVRVLLGEGEGQNWWCVMFPPMCLDIATESAPSYSESEEDMIRLGEYSVKFKILETVSDLIAKFSKNG